MTLLAYQEIINSLPIGIFVINREQKIFLWNSWLVEQTSISEKYAVGRSLVELFANFNNSRFSFAVEQVLMTRSPQIMSQALNRYLIPIHLKNTGFAAISMMQQQVRINYLRGTDNQDYVMVSIMDATDSVIRSSALIEVAQRLQHDSIRDPLTALYNRRFMWEWLAQQIKLSNRYGYLIACLVLDIDHFKQINDKHGHKEGDAVLRSFSEVVGAHMRQSDILVRYGGEEFVVLMPQCDLEPAIGAAWRIIDTVRTAAMGSLKPGQVTCSIGIAIYDSRYPQTEEEFLKKADQHLYEAKNSGRDRVVPAHAGMVHGSGTEQVQ